MRRMRLIAMLFLVCVGMNGCASYGQLENQAFVIMLAIDLSPDGEVELTAQIPKIGSGGGEKSGEESGSGYIVAKASGETFSSALELMSAVVPRRINLTQVKLIAVSEQLAQNNKFRKLMVDISETYQLYGTAHLVVCSGNAGAFIENQKPVIGSRISTAIIAMLDHYKEQGYIPDSTLADVYYQSNSVYGDPLVILAGTESEVGEAASEIPPDIFPDRAAAQLEDDGNNYLGAAIMKDGVMVGKLSAREMLFANLIRGRMMKFNYSMAAESLSLTPEGMPEIEIDTDEGFARIRYEQTLLAVPLADMPDAEKLERALAEDITEVINKCRSLGADPFSFAERAAGNFLTTDEWLRYGWKYHFANADIQVKIDIKQLEE